MLSRDRSPLIVSVRPLHDRCSEGLPLKYRSIDSAQGK